jgi:uncharacterized protein (TIGR03118 family)
LNKTLTPVFIRSCSSIALIYLKLKMFFMKKLLKLTAYCLQSTPYFLLLSFMLITNACRKHDFKKLKDFEQVNLVDNNGEYGAPHKDSTLINAWGLAWSPTGIAWVNSQAGHVSELYDKDGNTVRAAVNIPSPGDTIGGNPTGIVFNGTSDFVLSNGSPARFIFVGVDGVLSGWNGAAGNNALLIKNNSATSAYTGLAIGASEGANYIYAADFRAGKIEVWDKSFGSVAMPFTDPGLPAGYSPFNIQAIGEWLYVMYAKVGPDGRDLKGIGNGVVSIFKTDGTFVDQFASGNLLNSPWGIAQAPAGFFQEPEDDDSDKDGDDDHDKAGEHKSDSITILIGNFGDGRINAYTPHGRFSGQLRSHGHPVVIDGLWALSFAPSTATAIDPKRLYFTAGPDEEKDGLFGYLIKK